MAARLTKNKLKDNNLRNKSRIEMKKECFTCVNKISTEITSIEQRRIIYREEREDGNNDPYVGDLDYHCKITGKRIHQIDPACENYSGDDIMEAIRKDIAKTAKKLREELDSSVTE